MTGESSVGGRFLRACPFFHYSLITSSRRGFTGQYHDAETSLIYFHARYYNPATGHFMTPDSVVPNPNDTYSYDRYAYVRNNPVNLTDPTGHFGALIGAIAGAIVGGIMAWISGGNIWEGMVMGAIAGACFGAIGTAPR